MKATGIVKEVDRTGVVTIPKELLKLMDIRKNGNVEFYTEYFPSLDREALVIVPYANK